MYQGSKKQRWIGRSSGDDNLRSHAQRLADGAGT
jgi:hypothetical protein